MLMVMSHTKATILRLKHFLDVENMLVKYVEMKHQRANASVSGLANASFAKNAGKMEKTRHFSSVVKLPGMLIMFLLKYLNFGELY